MTTFFRILRLFSLVSWVGGLLFFIAAVTRVAFSVLPDAHLAGAVVRGTLQILHRIGFGAGVVYIASTLTLIATQRDSHIARALEILIAGAMVLLTGYSQFSVLPRMEADRLSLGGVVETASPDLPAHKHFDRLHRVSVRVESTILIGGLILVCLAPLPRRDDMDRVQF